MTGHYGTPGNGRRAACPRIAAAAVLVAAAISPGVPFGPRGTAGTAVGIGVVRRADVVRCAAVPGCGRPRIALRGVVAGVTFRFTVRRLGCIAYPGRRNTTITMPLGFDVLSF